MLDTHSNFGISSLMRASISFSTVVLSLLSNPNLEGNHSSKVGNLPNNNKDAGLEHPFVLRTILTPLRDLELRPLPTLPE